MKDETTQVTIPPDPGRIIKWVYRVLPDGSIEVTPVYHGKPPAQVLGVVGIESEEKVGEPGK